MTTTAVATGSRTMETAARPRRSLEELVDQLFEAMGFKEEPETAELSAPHAIHEAPAAQAGGGHRRRAQRSRRHGLGEGGDAGVPLGLLRVEGAGQVAVRRPGRRALPPGRRGHLRSPRSWGCGGSRASWSRSAACGGCGPWGGLALDRLGREARRGRSPCSQRRPGALGTSPPVPLLRAGLGLRPLARTTRAAR